MEPRIVDRVETAMTASGLYSLPGKHVLGGDVELEAVTFGVAETPIRRAKVAVTVLQKPMYPLVTGIPVFV